MSEKDYTYITHQNEESKKDISYFKKVVQNTIRLVIDRTLIIEEDGKEKSITFDYENGRHLESTLATYKIRKDIKVNGDIVLNPLLTDDEFVEYSKMGKDDKNIHRRNFSAIFYGVEDPKYKLAVFHLEKKEGKDETANIPTENVNRIVQFNEKRPIDIAIVITPVALVRQAKEHINTLSLALGSSSRCQVFLEDELLYNVPSHSTVPIAVRMSKEEKENFLRETGCVLSNIQSMYISDPLSKYFGFDVGDIIKLFDKSLVNSNIADYFVDYRRVIGV